MVRDNGKIRRNAVGARILYDFATVIADMINKDNERAGDIYVMSNLIHFYFVISFV